MAGQATPVIPRSREKRVRGRIQTIPAMNAERDAWQIPESSVEAVV